MLAEVQRYRMHTNVGARRLCAAAAACATRARLSLGAADNLMSELMRWGVINAYVTDPFLLEPSEHSLNSTINP